MSKDPLDRFYTNPDFVDIVLGLVNINEYGLVVEPSAGNGSFSNKIPNCLAFDINPEGPNIIKQDFLEYEYNEDVPRENVLCIGNPPFGSQTSTAIKFVNKCAEFADTIAFILPMSCKKESIQRRFPNTFHLIKQITVPDNSFIFNSNTYHVPCVFQIWKNKYQPRLESDDIKPIGFRYCNQEDAHLSIRRVGVYAGKCYRDLNKSKQSHYFIHVDDISLIDLIYGKLNEFHWEHNNTVGPKSISKQELNLVLNNIVFNS